MRAVLTAWSVYALFMALAVYLSGDALSFGGPHGELKLLVWGVLMSFLAYSVYCSLREDFVRSLCRILALRWGRQIGLDLYMGLALVLGFIVLLEGPLAAALWAVPVLLFANLSVLLYVALHFDAIVLLLTG